MLRLYRNHSALLDSLHAPTQPYTTTYQPYCSHRGQLVAIAGSEIPLTLGCTYGLVTAFSTPSFRGSFAAAYLQDSSCQWFAYLPGLSLHVPRRLRKVRDSNPRVAVEQYRTYAFAALLCCCLSTQPTFLCLCSLRRHFMAAPCLLLFQQVLSQQL